MNKNYQPKGKRFHDFEVGEIFYTSSRTITEADIINFASWTWDTNPIHIDEEFAKHTLAKTRIAHGALTLAYANGLADSLGILDGTAQASLRYDVKMTGFVKAGDTISVKITVVDKKLTSKGDRGVVFCKMEVLNQRDEVVLINDCEIMFMA